ncbi:MAG: metal ABC transporter permease [Candidatus Korarchaeota archaeon]|nr:metal ABC transporter permease [Thermoproteota archaeon]
MDFMIALLLEAIVASSVSGGICGYLGVYLQRLKLITLGFAVAHGALAGASIAIMMGCNVEILAFAFGILIAMTIETLHAKFNVERDLASMFLFSFSSAVAIIAIYLTPTMLLTSDIASLLLWGSILVITLGKIILLLAILAAMLIYTRAFCLELNSLLFDSKLAESEGINIEFHAMALIVFSAGIISVMLRFIGGLLLFSMIFGPAVSATTVTHRRQALVGALVGSAAGIFGVLVSFYFDLPIGATIALSIITSSIVVAVVSRLYHNFRIRRLLNY